MKPLTAFQKMRKQRDERIARHQRAESNRRYEESRQRTRQYEKESQRLEMEEIYRKSKQEVDLAIYQAGMAMWGSDLTACLFHPKPHNVPNPPVLGGEPYKMMKMERP